MTKQSVSFLVRVVDALDPTRHSSLEQALGKHAGVTRTTVSQRSDRLLLVDYDPFETSAQHILATVRGRGIDALLIGL